MAGLGVVEVDLDNRFFARSDFIEIGVNFHFYRAADFRRDVGAGEIVVNSIDADGTMQAAYYNPTPIHVSQAKATREGDAWRNAAGEAAQGVERDQFNRVTFVPQECQAIRLEVQLQPGFSGGILEWRLIADPPARE